MLWQLLPFRPSRPVRPEATLQSTEVSYQPDRSPLPLGTCPLAKTLSWCPRPHRLPGPSLNILLCPLLPDAHDVGPGGHRGHLVVPAPCVHSCLAPVCPYTAGRGHTQHHTCLNPCSAALRIQARPSPGMQGPAQAPSGLSLATPWLGPWPPGLSPRVPQTLEVSSLPPRPSFAWPLPGVPPLAHPSAPLATPGISRASSNCWPAWASPAEAHLPDGPAGCWL